MTIINEKKERVEIVVYTYIRSGRCEYRISDILITPFRKRKAISVAAMIRDRYEYRKLDYDERPKYVHQEFLKYCTEEQIAQAVQEAYEELKPTSIGRLSKKRVIAGTCDGTLEAYCFPKRS